MISETDRELIERVDLALAADKTYRQIANDEGLPLGTLYHRIRALGYKTKKRLAPIHAPSLNTEE